MSNTADVANRPAKTVLKAVIIYDEFDSATRATALLERAATLAAEATRWDIKPWRLEVLKQPALAALTVAVAANADLIVLAMKQPQSMPAELLAWLKNWAQHRRVEDAALLALPSGENAAPWNELRTFAEQGGLIYLDKDNAEEGGNTARFGDRQQKRSAALAPARILAGRLPLPSRWGINE